MRSIVVDSLPRYLYYLRVIRNDMKYFLMSLLHRSLACMKAFQLLYKILRKVYSIFAYQTLNDIEIRITGWPENMNIIFE